MHAKRSTAPSRTDETAAVVVHTAHDVVQRLIVFGLPAQSCFISFHMRTHVPSIQHQNPRRKGPQPRQTRTFQRLAQFMAVNGATAVLHAMPPYRHGEWDDNV